MNLHPVSQQLFPSLASGLFIELKNNEQSYSGLIQGDANELQAYPSDNAKIVERGSVLLSNNGPLVRHQFIIRDGLPGIEVDLTIINGECSYKERTPAILSGNIFLDAPMGFSWISRFPWIKITKAYVEVNTFVVTLPYPLYQAGLLYLGLALVPNTLMVNGEPHSMVTNFLTTLPYLPKLKRVAFPTKIKNIQAVLTKARKDFKAFLAGAFPNEFAYLLANYGGLTGGNSIRGPGDFGKEFLYALTDAEYYLLMKRWQHEIHARPQRGYFSFMGYPAEASMLPSSFKSTVGPNNTLFANKQQNPLNFLDVNPVKGSQDLQHGSRWFGPTICLAEMEDTHAQELLVWMASAARLDYKDPRNHVGPGYSTLGRGHAWCAILHAESYKYMKYPHTYAWMMKMLQAAENAQTPFGGLMNQTSNKEAKDYGRQFEANRINAELLAADPEGEVTLVNYLDLPVLPVSQPPYEILLLRSLIKQQQVGIPVKDETLFELANFNCNKARGANNPSPYYRVGTDGKQLDHSLSNHYYGLTMYDVWNQLYLDESQIVVFEDALKDFAPKGLESVASAAYPLSNRWELMEALALEENPEIKVF